ncbi:receptor-type tyrosine-protein phosphatase T-like [Watersipora subatra]|uniref:receptor-type tyrosine-protein phosphatase T-like n=1 Tax=Watersipora subatra TaxID=2589382 RepID=UPI00355C02A9
MVVTTKWLWLIVLAACSAAQNSSSKPISDIDLSCELGAFLKDALCLTCHCAVECGCDQKTGCMPCNNQNICAFGFSGFPACQTKLERPTIDTLNFGSSQSGEIEFQIDDPPTNQADLTGAAYKISCKSSTGTSHFGEIPIDVFDYVPISVPQGVYQCTATLALGLDQSLPGPSFTVATCTAWKDAKNEATVNSRLQTESPHLLIVDVDIPNVTYCEWFAVYEYQINSLSGDKLLTKSASAKSDLLGIYDTESKLELGVMYTSLLKSYDGDDELGEVQLNFTAQEVEKPVILTNSSTFEQTAGAVVVKFDVWNRSMNSGNVAPDEYSVEYRVLNTTYPLGWSAQLAVIQDSHMSATLLISHPGESYEYKIVTRVIVRDQEYVAISPDTQRVDTLPCDSPSPFTLQAVKFTGGLATVMVRLTYTAADPNCHGNTQYRAYVSNDGRTQQSSCSRDIVCHLPNLEAYTYYNVSLEARNQAEQSTFASTDNEKGFLSFRTPKKVPDAPSELSYTVKGVEVTLSWSAPVKDKGGITGYSVAVKESSSQQTIEPLKDVGLMESYFFNGSWNTEYDVEVRASNEIGDGGTKKLTLFVPPTKPSVPLGFAASTLNEECIALEWSAPDFDGGVINSYVANCSVITAFSNKSIIRHSMEHDMLVADTRDLKGKICMLLAGCEYRCTLSAKNPAGLSPAAVQRAWTEPNYPLPPPQPQVLIEKTTDSTITLYLPEVDAKDLPASAYFVAVEKLTNSTSLTVINPKFLTEKNISRYKSIVPRMYITAKLNAADTSFVIGTNTEVGGYLNAPLTKGQRYIIYYGVRVTRGSVSKETFTRLEEPVVAVKYVDEQLRKQLIIGIVSALVTLFVALIIAAVALIMVKNRRSLFSRRPTMRAELIPLRRRRAMNRKSPDSDSVNGEVVEPLPVAVANLQSYVTAQLDQIYAQYKALPTGFLSSCTASLEPANKEKNRFANILPYDHSRVVLEVTPGIHSSDYINANYINGYSKKKCYIATSGPKETTCADFWRMVWQHEATCIVMVTKCVEEGKLKCQRYWPDHRKTETFDDLEVTNTCTEDWADFTMTTFSIRKESKTLICHHFLFLSWPDHGVPKNSTPFLLFRRKIKALTAGLLPPLIVHCSAGVGRTGTFIAIDFLLEQAEVEGEINVFHLVQSLRNQRVSMVQTAEQYRYIYQAVCEALASKDFHYPASQFLDRYVRWSENDIIGEQFESLAEISTQVNSDDFFVGNEKTNHAKNQNPAILPNDNHRLHVISQPSGYSSSYINAVFINSCRRKDLFIATQMPLPNTIEDYLRLIYDHEVPCVVALEADPFTNERFGVYLPVDPTSPLETELFRVTVTEVNDLRADIVIATVCLTYKQARGKSTHSFRYFQVNFWQQDKPLPDDKATFITLLEQVEKCQQMASAYSSVCVQCRDGNERTCLFIAIWNALERLKTDQEVDVFHTVELIRLVRPQAITDLAQYQFIYDMLFTYLQEFDLYANYS